MKFKIEDKNKFGKTKKYCIDCNKEIYRYDANRCKSCAGKEYLKDPTHHSQWAGGKPKCRECGKEITYTYIRCQNCELRRRIGKDHPCWKGGLSKLPYAEIFTERLKESIRKRDKHICQLCHKTQKQQLKELNRKLSIHHIDYNKQNCKEKNLITLCHKCNSHVNKERNYWIKYFKNRNE